MAKTTNKKKKANKRRLLLLLLLLLVTVLMLSTATYAWFTSNRKVAIEEIKVDVGASGGLEISTDAASWGVRVSKQDLLDADWADTATINPSNQIPATLANMSTYGNVVNGKMDMFLGITTTDADAGIEYLALSKENEVTSSCMGDTGTKPCNNNHFVAFDVFLKLDNDGTGEEKTIYVTSNSSVTETNNKGLKNAARVAFVREGYVDIDTYLGINADYDLGLIQSATVTGINPASNQNDVFIWEPNNDGHTNAGKTHAASYYGINSISSASALPYEGAVGACTNIPLDYWNSSAGRTLDGIKDGSNVQVTQWTQCFQPVTVKQSTQTTHDAFELFKIRPGVTKIRVYYWIEGNDVDTENNASASDTTLTLYFSLDNI